MSHRPLAEDDLDRVLAFLSADEEQLTGRASRLEPGDLRQWLTGVDFERHTWLFEIGDEIAAFGWLGEARSEVAFAVGVTGVPFKGRGLGGLLVDRAEAAMREAPARRLHQIAFAQDGAAATLLRSRGYEEVRRFYEMAVELTERPAEATLPEGLALEQFDVQEARAFHAALDEAFQDHWEHHPRTFEDWWERRMSSNAFDPAIWYLVRDGDEIAATISNEAGRNGGGYVGAIGVRRPWRGRGLARALLLHTFREFYDRGTTRVTLGVDAQNPTGALALYESVGMAPEQEQVVFEKAFA